MDELRVSDKILLNRNMCVKFYGRLAFIYKYNNLMFNKVQYPCTRDSSVEIRHETRELLKDFIDIRFFILHCLLVSQKILKQI